MVRVLATLALACLTMGCENHLCDVSAATWGMTAGQGDIIPGTEDVYWESSPMYGTWAPFPHMVTETFDIGASFPGCTPVKVDEYISPDPMPSVGGGNSVTVAGNTAEVLGASPPGTVTVFNDSCADYYIRVVVLCSETDAGAGGG